MPVIDIHNHFFPRAWPDLAARYGTPNWPWIKHTEPGKADVMIGDRFFRHIYSACWDPQKRLEEMGGRSRNASSVCHSCLVCLRSTS